MIIQAACTQAACTQSACAQSVTKGTQGEAPPELAGGLLVRDTGVTPIACWHLAPELAGVA